MPSGTLNQTEPLNRNWGPNKDLLMRLLALPDQQKGTIWRDIAGRNNGAFGASTAAPVWAPQSKRVNSFGCVSFDGSNDYVGLTQSTGLSGSFTIACWVNVASISASVQNFMSSEVASYSNYWAALGTGTALGIVNKGYFALYDGTNNPITTTTATLTTGVWTHLVGVRDTVAGKIFIYQDGKLQGTGTTDSTTTVPTYSAFSIGGQQNQAGRYNPGKQDDCVTCNRAWSAADVQAIYQDGLTGYRNGVNRMQPRMVAPAAVSSGPSLLCLLGVG